MSCTFASANPSSANVWTAASRMRGRRCAAGIRVLAIPNTNSVGFDHITEPQFGWTECYGSHEATDPLVGPARLHSRALGGRRPAWRTAGPAHRPTARAGGTRHHHRRESNPP